MWPYKDHGKSWQTVCDTEYPPGFRWLHESFGTNWRMTELQGVLGRMQLGRLDRWQARRSANASAIWAACRDCDWLRVTEVPEHMRHAVYKAYAFVVPEALPDGWSRDGVIAALGELGIPAFSGSCSEIYREKAFDGTGFRPLKPLPVARELGDTSLMFLVHPTLTDDEIGRTCETIRTVDERLRSGQPHATAAAAHG